MSHDSASEPDLLVEGEWSSPSIGSALRYESLHVVPKPGDVNVTNVESSSKSDE